MFCFNKGIFSFFYMNLESFSFEVLRIKSIYIFKTFSYLFLFLEIPGIFLKLFVNTLT